jgi:hypothetical protein
VAFQSWLSGQATSQGISALDDSEMGSGFTIKDVHPHFSASYLEFKTRIRQW